MVMEKALALVVRGTDWSETSRIATLWTREFGKVRALAKGGRRLRSNFEVAFDLLTVCHIVVIRKHTGGLDLLTEAQVAERFPQLRTDLSALHIGYYVAELLSDGTQDYDPHPFLFDTAVATLRSLADRDSDRPCVASTFELAWLKELGYSPRLDTCAACDVDLSGPDVGRVGYSPSTGGVLCPGCAPAVRDHRVLSGGAIAALRGMARGVPELSAGIRREVRQTLGQTVSYILGRRPRLLGYVDGG